MGRLDQPNHIQDALRAIEKMRTEHYDHATQAQRLVNRITALFSQPKFLGYVVLAIMIWIVGNAAVSRIGLEAWDPPPFPWLGLAASLGALTVTGLILAAQRHDDVLASHREQLTLELAILSEQKNAKIIELLEALRRDDPLVQNREDQQANEMASPAEPAVILDAIKTTEDDL